MDKTPEYLKYTYKLIREYQVTATVTTYNYDPGNGTVWSVWDETYSEIYFYNHLTNMSKDYDKRIRLQS